MPTYRFPRPAVTVDVVCFAVTAEATRVLLIERRAAPFAGTWALPGGFLDLDEELADAARRELEEETGVVASSLLEVGMFGAVGRDPRGRTISCAFAALWLGEPPAARSGDDAADARWWALRRLPRLAFDHRDVVRRARDRVAERIRLDGAPLELLPERFTAGDLAALHAAFVGEPVSGTALRRRLERGGAIVAKARRGRAVELAVRRR